MFGPSRVLELTRMMLSWSTAPEHPPFRHGPEPSAELLALAAETKGFLDIEEGKALFRLALHAARIGPCLEIGSYCGRSALFLGEGCRVAGAHPLFCLDHHRGSAEQQPGQPYFDAELYDPATNRFTTLERLAINVKKAGLEDWAVPMVGSSALVGRYWPMRNLGLVFIDGGHGAEDVVSDYETWAPRVRVGGFLCFHDLFADPAEGGQAPLRVFERARAERGWAYCGQLKTLGVLRRCR